MKLEAALGIAMAPLLALGIRWLAKKMLSRVPDGRLRRLLSRNLWSE